MIGSRFFLLMICIVTLSVLAVGCGGAEEAGTPVQAEGPALVMFYIDN